MSAIQFSVIDLACESADQSFFPPKVTMTTKSTTQIATVLGFPEYPGFESTPPKRYKKVTWVGSSEAQLWYAAQAGNPTAYQVAGSRFDYAGSSEIDSQGNYISLYTKNFFAMCNAIGALFPTLLPLPPGSPLSVQVNLSGQSQTTSLEPVGFPGWIGPTQNLLCNPPGTPYAFVSNMAVGKGALAINDTSTLWGSKKVDPTVTNIQGPNFVVQSSTFAQCIDSGDQRNDGVFIALVHPIPVNGSVDLSGPNQGVTWFFGGPVWNHNFSCTLSDEYTDAEALTNAQVIVGVGATAQNKPRTTGLVSTFTNVVYTLNLSSLIPGSNYTVTVDIWNPGTGVTTPKSYSVSPTGTTQVIIDTVPVPPVGQSLQVRNPRIVFA